MEVTRSHQAVTAVVSRPTQHQHARMLLRRVHVRDSVSTTEASQLHELVQRKALLRAHQLVVYGLRLGLREISYPHAACRHALGAA